VRVIIHAEGADKKDTRILEFSGHYSPDHILIIDSKWTNLLSTDVDKEVEDNCLST